MSLSSKSPVHRVLVAVLLLGALGCGRKPAPAVVEPVALDAVPSPEDVEPGPGAADATDATDAAPAPDVPPPTPAPATGGLWVVDAVGDPVGVLVQRGHPSLSAGGQLDLLRDGVVVYSPKAGLFFGLQMSSGKVVAPRLGVADASCAQPIVAGYYTDGAIVSGFSYAFVYLGKWYRVADGKPLELVSCGGTVADGVDGKCAPHGGSCRGFPVEKIQPPLPTAFAPPLGFAWLAP